jgi:hypothetical protein
MTNFVFVPATSGGSVPVKSTKYYEFYTSAQVNSWENVRNARGDWIYTKPSSAVPVSDTIVAYTHNGIEIAYPTVDYDSFGTVLWTFDPVTNKIAGWSPVVFNFPESPVTYTTRLWAKVGPDTTYLMPPCLEVP